jgi:hypothetical protein
VNIRKSVNGFLWKNKLTVWFAGALCAPVILLLSGCGSMLYTPTKSYPGDDLPDSRIATVVGGYPVHFDNDQWLVRIVAVDGVKCEMSLSKRMAEEPVSCGPVQLLPGDHTFTLWARTVGETVYTGYSRQYKWVHSKTPFELKVHNALRPGYLYFILPDVQKGKLPSAKIVEMCRSDDHISSTKKIFNKRFTNPDPPTCDQ